MKLAHLFDLPLSALRLTRGLAAAVVLAGALGASTRGPDKVLLRYRPRAGTVTRFHAESHFSVSGQVISGVRPDRALRLAATDSVAVVEGDSVVRVIVVDSMTRTDAGYSTGELGAGRALFGFGTVWTDRRIERRLAPGPSPFVIYHVIPDLVGGTAPLPDAPVGPGDSWKGEAMFFITQIDSLGALRARIEVKLKSIMADGPDTTVLLQLRFKVEGPSVFFRDMNPPQTQQISGTLEGVERFSLTRGLTDSLALSGTLSTEFDLGGAGRSSLPTSVSLLRWRTP